MSTPGHITITNERKTTHSTSDAHLKFQVLMLDLRMLKFVSFALSVTLMCVTDGTNERKPEPPLRLE